MFDAFNPLHLTCLFTLKIKNKLRGGLLGKVQKSFPSFVFISIGYV
jgi:hypothetical protein